MLPAGWRLLLGGCGGIDFQGKVFDYAGLSSLGKEQEDVRMTERAPLLVPPNTHKLPPPGSPDVTRADWPADTDKERKRLAAARQAEERKKAAEGEPNNPYAGKPNLLDQVLGRNKTPEEDPLDVPEPDPSDKTAEDKARERTAATPQKPVDQSLNAPTTPPDRRSRSTQPRPTATRACRTPPATTPIIDAKRGDARAALANWLEKSGGQG